MEFYISKIAVGMIKVLLGKGEKLLAIKYLKGQVLAPGLREAKLIVEAIGNNDYHGHSDTHVKVVIKRKPEPLLYHNYACVVLEPNGTIGMVYADTLTGTWVRQTEIDDRGAKTLSVLRMVNGRYEPYV